MNVWKWSTLALLAALLAGGAGAAITGGLYPAQERAYAYRAQMWRCAVTSANTALSVTGESGKGSKNLSIRNDGPEAVYVSVDSTAASTVASASHRLPDGYSLNLADFYTTGIGLKCASGTTAAVEVLVTY